MTRASQVSAAYSEPKHPLPAQRESVQRAAVVTGASTGIGEATALELDRRGWRVYAVARRAGRLESLARRSGVIPVAADISEDDGIAAVLDLVEQDGGVDTLINIAGGARGADPIAAAKTEDWEWMYRVNVLGTMKLIRAFLPMLRAQGSGTVLNLSSTAALISYEGRGGYNAAKAAERALTRALRLEEAEHNVRVIEVLPGMVKTAEFSLSRLGDPQAAAEVYRGVAEPLLAEDVADVIAYAVCLSHHINLDEIVIRPVAQAAQHKVIRS